MDKLRILIFLLIGMAIFHSCNKDHEMGSDLSENSQEEILDLTTIEAFMSNSDVQKLIAYNSELSTKIIENKEIILRANREGGLTDAQLINILGYDFEEFQLIQNDKQKLYKNLGKDLDKNECSSCLNQAEYLSEEDQELISIINHVNSTIASERDGAIVSHFFSPAEICVIITSLFPSSDLPLSCRVFFCYFNYFNGTNYTPNASLCNFINLVCNQNPSFCLPYTSSPSASTTVNMESNTAPYIFLGPFVEIAINGDWIEEPQDAPSCLLAGTHLGATTYKNQNDATYAVVYNDISNKLIYPFDFLGSSIQRIRFWATIKTTSPIEVKLYTEGEYSEALTLQANMAGTCDTKILFNELLDDSPTSGGIEITILDDAEVTAISFDGHLQTWGLDNDNIDGGVCCLPLNIETEACAGEGSIEQILNGNGNSAVEQVANLENCN